MQLTLHTQYSPVFLFFVKFWCRQHMLSMCFRIWLSLWSSAHDYDRGVSFFPAVNLHFRENNLFDGYSFLICLSDSDYLFYGRFSWILLFIFLIKFMSSECPSACIYTMLFPIPILGSYLSQQAVSRHFAFWSIYSFCRPYIFPFPGRYQVRNRVEIPDKDL